MKNTLLLIFLLFPSVLFSQNIFPFKLNNCVTDSFCLDCGDEKAGVEPEKFKQLIENLNKSNDYSKISGKVLFQVLVDSLGKGCVLSHTDVSNSQIVRNIVEKLNGFEAWTPAKTKGKIERKTSFNFLVEIKAGVLNGKIDRVDVEAFTKSFDRPVLPEIYNKTYAYKNENLKKYEIKVWNSVNSKLPNNQNDHITVDMDNTIWLTADESVVRLDGEDIIKVEHDIKDKAKYHFYQAITADNNNVKWAVTGQRIYSYSDGKWTAYDPKEIGVGGAFDIVNNPGTGEVFFCTDKGLTIYRNGEWSVLNKSKIKEFPSDRIAFAKKDSKGRLWIGTYDGSVLIDEDGKTTSFNDTNTVLKGKCITSMDEDEKGNLFFGLYEFERKNKTSANNDEGIAIRYADGKIKQFTTSNSGMPFNHVTKVLYDKYEQVLWMATDRAGLVRYDLKGNWENYHNENSGIPTSYIADMVFDKKGVLYLATRQGLVRVQRK